MLGGVPDAYRNQTETHETHEALRTYIDRDLDGGRVPIDTVSYLNDMVTINTKDDVPTLLVHLGYRGYDSETCEALNPNGEAMQALEASTRG